MTLNLVGFSAMLFTALSAALLAGLTLWRRKKPAIFRRISSLERLRESVGLAVEKGLRLHFALGRAGMVSQHSAASFSALSMTREIAEKVSASDYPPIATSGDPALTILSQDILYTAYERAGALNRYSISSGRLGGLTPFSYASAEFPVIRDERVLVNIAAGNFGVEASLISDAANREQTLGLAAADTLPAQAIFFASAADPLIGEEIFALGAYSDAGAAHEASLQAQDILRWLLIFLMVGGAVLKAMGLL